MRIWWWMLRYCLYPTLSWLDGRVCRHCTSHSSQPHCFKVIVCNAHTNYFKMLMWNIWILYQKCHWVVEVRATARSLPLWKLANQLRCSTLTHSSFFLYTLHTYNMFAAYKHHLLLFMYMQTSYVAM